MTVLKSKVRNLKEENLNLRGSSSDRPKVEIAIVIWSKDISNAETEAVHGTNERKVRAVVTNPNFLVPMPYLEAAKLAQKNNQLPKEDMEKSN